MLPQLSNELATRQILHQQVKMVLILHTADERAAKVLCFEVPKDLLLIMDVLDVGLGPDG